MGASRNGNSRPTFPTCYQPLEDCPVLLQFSRPLLGRPQPIEMLQFGKFHRQGPLLEIQTAAHRYQRLGQLAQRPV